MKIAYVTLHLEKKYIFGGVGRKIREHIRLWNYMGHQAQQFLLTPDEINLPDIRTFRFGSLQRWKPARFIAREVSRSRQLARMIDEIAEFAPDLIYLRYGFYTIPLDRLYRIAPVVVEVNTDDVIEYRQRGMAYDAGNRLFRNRILGQSSGMVLISRELAGRSVFTRFQKPMLVLSNGIDPDSIDPLPAPGNANPTIAFVGVPGLPWNGEDKLLDFIIDNPDIHLDMIGFKKDDISDDLHCDNVTFYGMVENSKVRSLLAGVDVCAGTLALHRKELEENSALKVRESLAMGIPTILGYYDTDVSGRGIEGILELPNTEDNVRENAQAIREFIFAMRGKRVDREAVRPLIDQKIKEERRLAFFEEILVQKSKQ